MNQKQAFDKAQRTSVVDKTEVFVVWNGQKYSVVYEDSFAGDEDQIVASFSKGYKVR